MCIRDSLQHIDYQADVSRFKQQKSRKAYEDDGESLDEFEDEESKVGSSLGAEEEEEADQLGDLPDLTSSKTTTGKQKKRKERRKKGAMSDVSGFSMTSSAIARSEALTLSLIHI